MRPALWKAIILSALLVTSCRLMGSEEGTPATEQEEATVTVVAQATQDRGVAVARAEKGEAGGQAADATGTPLLTPEPTPDPAADAWTILVYVSADNDLASSSLQALNDMEAAGPPAESSVVVQIDGPRSEAGTGEGGAGALRFYLGGDDDPQELGSTLLANLGPTNMGDPQTLTEFVAWGVERFPARHYALIIRGQGGGWRGVAYDGGEADELSMPDLQGALQRALSQAGLPRLDVIGLDAPLMGQLEVLEAVQPYANYAVASPGLQSLTAWQYGDLLADLDEDPEQDGATLAQAMAQSVGDDNGQVTGPASGAMAVDLQRMPQVTTALASLVDLMQDRLPLLASATARARQTARSYGDLIPRESYGYAARDLGDFAVRLAQESPLYEVSRASQALADSVAGVLVAKQETPEEAAEEAGQRGLSFYFPAAGQAYDDAYGDVFGTPWATFLERYYEAAAQVSLVPQLSMATLSEEAAGAQRPANLSLELGGLDVAQVSLVALRPQGDGSRRLFTYEPLPANGEPDAAQPGVQTWRDGVQQTTEVWNTTAAHVSDGANGDFVLLQEAGSQGEVYAVEGRYLAAEGAGPVEATLLFDGETRGLDAVWGFPDGARGNSPQRLLPRAGDEFQLFQATMDEQWAVNYEPGATLVFTEGSQITLDSFPLPSGEYQVGFVAQTSLGQRAGIVQDVVVDNEDLTPGYQAYLDSRLGFQFLYPVLWSAPAYEGDVLLARGPQGELQLTVSVRQGPETGTASDLQARALQAFGQVHVLYEENVVVAGENGLLTAYGYQGEEEARTGLLITFVSGEQDLGFVVDLDGPAETEGEMIEVADRLISSWEFRPLDPAGQGSGWRRLTIAELNVAVPTGYGHQTLENGWEVLKREEAFVALRRDPLQRGGRPQIVAHWLEVAARGVESFTAGEPTKVALAGKVWSRTEFEYVAEAGAMKGFIMATILNGEEIVAWAEAPDAVYEERMVNPFTLLVADAVAPLDGRSGLLYEATFEESAGWGVGEMDGARAAAGDGAYQLQVSADRGFFWATAGQSFGDAVFELRASQTAGPLDNGYGMILRADEEAAAFYVFAVSGDGYAWIGRCEDGCARATTLQGPGWLRSDAVSQGHDAANRLRVEALGAEMVFSVNGVEVARVRDGTLAAGDVGFFVETLGEGGVGVRFDELRVTAW